MSYAYHYTLTDPAIVDAYRQLMARRVELRAKAQPLVELWDAERIVFALHPYRAHGVAFPRDAAQKRGAWLHAHWDYPRREQLNARRLLAVPRVGGSAAKKRHAALIEAWKDHATGCDTRAQNAYHDSYRARAGEDWWMRWSSQEFLHQGHLLLATHAPPDEIKWGSRITKVAYETALAEWAKEQLR